MNETVQEIKTLFARNNIPVFGITKSSHLENDALGYRPSDSLPSAESMLCMGVPFPKGVFQHRERSNQAYWRAANIYYRNVDAMLMQVARIIEEQGAVAVPVFGCFPYDVRGRGDFWGYLSLVKMAEAVSIGKIGKNGLLFNSQYGPRLMLGGIITTAVLPAMTWPKKNEIGCPDECFVCQEQCPVGAIDKKGKVDRLACVKYSMKSPIFSYFMKTKSFDASDAEMINHVTGVDDHSMYTCIKCVSMCPYNLKAQQ